MNTIECNKSKEYYTFSSHRHPDTWEISLQIKGNIEIAINDKQYYLKENDIRVLPPGVSHSGSSNEYCTDIFLQANHLDFSDIVITHDYDGNILKLFEIQSRILAEKEKNYQKIADSITDTICEYIKKYTNINYKYPFTFDFKNILYNNVSNCDFIIADEIQKMGFNVDYFRRCFKEDFHKTPLEHLTQLRIELAKKMLKQNPIHSIEKIALQCGYKDIYYFSKVFKKHTNLSPDKYRKTQQNSDID